jgi:hypothetical protein
MTSQTTGKSVKIVEFVIRNTFKNIHYYFIRPWIVTKGFIEMGGGMRFRFREKQLRWQAHKNRFYRFIINKKILYERQTKKKDYRGRVRRFEESGEEWIYHPWGRYGYIRRKNLSEEEGRGSRVDEGGAEE